MQMVPAVEGALNLTYKGSIRSHPLQVKTARAPPTTMSAQSAGQADWDVDWLDEERVPDNVSGLMRAPEDLPRDVRRRLASNRRR